MHALKRFTQCGSLTMLFAVFIVLFGVSSTALTTFGKAPPAPAPPPPVKGMACSTSIECENIRHTSCVDDPDDHVSRCLCGDNSTPVNGYCPEIKVKKFRHKCEQDTDCDGDLICSLINNATKSTGFNRAPVNILKLCQCPDRTDEYDDSCNGALQLAQGMLFPLVSVLIALVLSKQS